MMRGPHVVLCAALALTAAVLGDAQAAGPRPDALRVCADPNNLPFSDRQEDGFENRLAELVAADLGRQLSYAWWPQRRGFIRNTLKADKCDVIIGVPAGLEMVATTRPYYRSSYVFVSRTDRRLDLRSISDPRLRTLSIGVQLVGDDGVNTPPVHALASQGIVDNVIGYPVYGDYGRPAPAAAIVRAVEDGTLDVAAVWGPLGGYFASRGGLVPLTVAPIADSEAFAPLRFEFDIAMAVRKGDEGLRAKLDQAIARKRPEIEAVLAAYGIPLVTLDPAAASYRPAAEQD